MENNTGKYFKYAIGEIILVVIGILIALSINNWNENRKLRNQEINILVELKSNLEATLYNFKKDTLFNIKTIQNYTKIKRYINEDLPYDQELDYSFALIENWSSPYPILTAYKSLQATGLDIISNEEIRREIINLYEYEYPLLHIDYDKSEWNLNQNVVTPFFSKHIRRITIRAKLNQARPNDFERLKKNDEFLNILQMLISLRQDGLINYKNSMKSLEKLIQNLEAETLSR